MRVYVDLDGGREWTRVWGRREEGVWLCCRDNGGSRQRDFLSQSLSVYVSMCVFRAIAYLARHDYSAVDWGVRCAWLYIGGAGA